MPVRQTLPSDDLYARLGVPRDASPEAIELAWRALLRRHHPDVAGETGLEVAKRINVAHDWLSDPDLRRRYDRERGVGIRSGRPPRAGGEWAGTVRRPAGRSSGRPPTTAELLASVIERVGRLTADELDRMALAEPAPIAFLATLRQVVPVELERQLDAAERSAMANLPPAARRSVPTRDAVVGRLADILLADVLEEILGDPASMWARERLTRGWDSAVGQPRYGPATVAVGTLVDRLGSMDDAGLRRLASTGTIERLGDAPWPQGTSPEEDDALRVSSELAGADAVAAVDAALTTAGLTAPRTVAATRRAAARIAHLIVLRHAFPARAFDRHAGPWLGDLIDRPVPWGGGIRGR